MALSITRTYKDAGVDVDAADDLVEKIKPLARATARPGVMGGLGSFAAVFDPVQSGYKDPLIVTTTDGVGTKLNIAINSNTHTSIGIDLVAMCVNDLITTGAEPMIFLDYIGTGRLDVGTIKDVIAGIAEGCRLAGCALVGGETAEMPGMYHFNDYDLAGFAMGMVERSHFIDGSIIAEGDVLLGLGSSGIHSNGFSLVRALVKKLGLELDSPAPFMESLALSDALLTPTRIYVKSLLPLIKTGKIKGLANITGSGITGNLPRILPNHLSAVVDVNAWTLSPVFDWLMESAKMSPEEMLSTFNCGIGMIAVVNKSDSLHIKTQLEKAGEHVFHIGEIVARPRPEDEVLYENITSAWAS